MRQIVGVSGTWLTRKAGAYFDIARHREEGAVTSNRMRGHEVEDTVAVTLEFAGGGLGAFVASDTAVAPWSWDQFTEDDPAFHYVPGTSCYTISGTLGSLTVPRLVHYRHLGRPDWTDPLAASALRRETGNS